MTLVDHEDHPAADAASVHGSRRFSTGKRVAVGIGVAAVASFALANVMFGGGEKDEKLPPAATPAATFRSCPDVVIDPLPPTFGQKDRVLRNLGGNLHGRSATFGDTSKWATVHVGYDALDEYDDLDFDDRVIEVDGRRVQVLVARAIADISPIRAAVWTDQSQGPEDRCRQLSVVTSTMSEPEFLSFIRAVTLAPG